MCTPCARIEVTRCLAITKALLCLTLIGALLGCSTQNTVEQTKRQSSTQPVLTKIDLLKTKYADDRVNEIMIKTVEKLEIGHGCAESNGYRYLRGDPLIADELAQLLGALSEYDIDIYKGTTMRVRS